MKDSTRVFIYTIGYLTLLGSWLSLLYFPMPGAEALITFIQSTLSALTGHVFTMINSGGGQ